MSELFIERAKVAHGDKYDYSKAKYNIVNDKIIIICPIHGEFLQSKYCHLIGCGCSKCAGCYNPNTEEYIKRAKKIHGDKYDYSEVNYINQKVKISIKCNICNLLFKQNPFSHLLGLYANTQKKEQHIKDMGYNLVAMWENNWIKINMSISILQNKFKEKYSIN